MADLTVRQAESVRLMIDSVRLVNRLQDYALSADSSETPEMPTGKITAAKLLLDKSLPSLQSADITAHSSPQTKDEGALIAELITLIQSNPLIGKALAPYLGHIPLSPPSAEPIDAQHTTVPDPT